MSEKSDHFVCDWEDCSKSFADKADLRKHVYNIHTAEVIVKINEGTRKKMSSPIISPITCFISSLLLCCKRP